MRIWASLQQRGVKFTCEQLAGIFSTHGLLLEDVGNFSVNEREAALSLELLILIIVQSCIWSYSSLIDMCMKGPAYSVQRIGLETYVKAAGLKHELIAVYEFEVVLRASYAIWMHFFATTNQTNDISFKVGEGDWYLWRPPHKGSHALWTQFFYEVCIYSSM